MSSIKLPVKIKIEESGLPYRRNYTKNFITITIDEYFIRSHYMMICEKCDSEDGQGSWEPTAPNWRVTYNRSSITGVGIHYVPKYDYYTVTVYINGSPDDLDFQLQDGEAAYDLFKKLEDLHITYITGKYLTSV